MGPTFFKLYCARVVTWFEMLCPIFQCKKFAFLRNMDGYVVSGHQHDLIMSGSQRYIDKFGQRVQNHHKLHIPMSTTSLL